MRPALAFAAICLLAVAASSCQRVQAPPSPALKTLGTLVLLPAVNVDSPMLLMGRYEVTQNEFDSFPENGELPVTMIPIEAAQTWAKERGFRLPTLQEWQFAAQDGAGVVYQTKGSLDGKANVMELGAHEALPVGVFERGATRFGLFDMMGNVWEWVAPEEKNGSLPGQVLACGGSFARSGEDLSTTTTRFLENGEAADDLGFRVCADAEAWLLGWVLPLWIQSKKGSEDRSSIIASFALWDSTLRNELAKNLKEGDFPPDFLDALSYLKE